MLTHFYNFILEYCEDYNVEYQDEYVDENELFSSPDSDGDGYVYESDPTKTLKHHLYLKFIGMTQESNHNMVAPGDLAAYLRNNFNMDSSDPDDIPSVGSRLYGMLPVTYPMNMIYDDIAKDFKRFLNQKKETIETLVDIYDKRIEWLDKMNDVLPADVIKENIFKEHGIPIPILPSKTKRKAVSV
jgi:hypothetical protein